MADESIKIPIIIENDQAFIALNDLAAASKRTSTAIKGVTDPMKAAGNASFAFNQILREAPAFAYSFQTGIIAISNNLPVFTDALKRARDAGNSNSEVLKGLGKSLISLPSILSFASLAFVTLGSKLFGTNKQFSEGEIAAAKFSAALKDVEESANSLKTSLDFEAKIAGLKAQLSGLSGNNLEIFKLGLSKENANKTIAYLDDQINKGSKLVKVYDSMAESIRKQARAAEQILGKDKLQGLPKLLTEFQDVRDIPEGLISKLSTKEAARLNEYRGLLDTLENLQKQKTTAQQLITTSGLEIEIKTQEEQKRLLDKSKEDYERYVNEIIAKAKKFYAALKDVINIAPGFKFFDTKSDEFRKSLEYLSKYNSGQYKLKVPIEPVLNLDGPGAPGANSFEDIFKKELSAFNDKNFTTDFTLIEALKKESEEIRKRNEALQQTVNIANTIASSFSNIFSEIANGANPIKALGNALKQLVIDLIRAALQSLILKVILNSLGLGGGAGAGNVGRFAGLSIPKFAKGGIAFGPTAGIFGEGIGTTAQNPEVVLGLDRLKGLIGDIVTGRSFGRGGNVNAQNNISNVPAYVEVYADGDSLRGVLSLTDQRQGRTR